LKIKLRYFHLSSTLGDDIIPAGYSPPYSISHPTSIPYTGFLKNKIASNKS